MNKSALIVIDFINDIVHMDGKFTATAKFVKEHAVIEKANVVISFARENKIPVVFVKVGFNENYIDCPTDSPVFGRAKEHKALQLNTWGTEFHEDIKILPNDLVIVKPRVSAFYATSLEPYLRANQIYNLIIAGVSTDMAVQTTAREAHDRDYKVIIVSDACGAGAEDAHDAALKGLQRVSVVTNSRDLSVEML
jgi:nicotinamidase-related amidase